MIWVKKKIWLYINFRNIDKLSPVFYIWFSNVNDAEVIYLDPLKAFSRIKFNEEN